MKWNKTILGTLSCIFMFSNSAFAHDCIIDGICYNLNDASMTAEVTYKGSSYATEEEYSGVVHVPSNIVYEGKEYNVTSIGEYAFYGCKSLEEVHIPSGITSLKNSTFENCNSLIYAMLPESLKEIGKKAFYNCTALKGVSEDNVLPNSVEVIGQYAFYKTAKLPLKVQSENLKEIQEYSFYESGITSVWIPEEVVSIPKYVFYGCVDLADVRLPKELGRIEDYAFYNCEKFEIQIPESLWIFGNYCLSGTAIKGELNIPEYFSLGGGTFARCKNLTHVKVPSSELLGPYTFNGCNLEKIEITSGTIIPAAGLAGIQAKEWILPNTLTTISASGLAGIQIEELILPNTLTTIHESGLGDCTIKKLTIPKSCTQIYRNAFGCVEELIFSDGESGLTLGERVNESPKEHFPKYVFYYATDYLSGLKYLYIGRNCTYGKIKNQELLTEITIGATVTDLREWAFANNPSLKTITCYATTPPSITNETFSNLPPDAVLYCPDAHKYGSWGAYFSKVVSMTGTGVDRYCEVDGIGYILDHVNQKAMVTYLGESFPSDEKYSGKITIPSHIYWNQFRYAVNGISEYAFYQCEGLTEVSLPDDIKEVGPYAFYQCENLSNINVNDKLTKIGAHAFEGCISLTKFNFSSQLQTLTAYCFSNSGLTGELQLPPTISSVNEGAFAGCKHLTHVVIPRGEFSADKVFDGCSLEQLQIISAKSLYKSFLSGLQVKELILPENLEKIKEEALTHTKIGKLKIPKSCKEIYPGSLGPIEELYIEDSDEAILLGQTTSGDLALDEGKYLMSAFKNMTGLKKLYIGRDHSTMFHSYDINQEGFNFKSGTILDDQSALEEISIGTSVSNMKHWNLNNALKLKTVTSYVFTAPKITAKTFACISRLAVLKYPEGSDYSAWLPYFSNSETHSSVNINEIVSEKETISTNSPIYDLQGRMVRPNSDTSGLPKGVYIVGGKTVVVE